jgi:hypothetical protein
MGTTYVGCVEHYSTNMCFGIYVSICKLTKSSNTHTSHGILSRIGKTQEHNIDANLLWESKAKPEPTLQC